MPRRMPRRLLLLAALVLGISVAVAACGGSDDTAGPTQAEMSSGGDASPGSDRSEGAENDGDTETASSGDAAAGAVTEAVGGAYGAGLENAATALEAELAAIADLVTSGGATSSGFGGDALAALESALPRLVLALQDAAETVAALDPPAGLRADHTRLVEGLETIARLEEELLLRVNVGDAAGALTRAKAIAAQQETLEASLSPAMRAAAGPLLGIAGALGFLPLAATDLAPSTAAELPAVEAESYLGRLDFPGAERLLTLDPLVVGGVVLITAQWSVPGATPVGEVLDFYEAALRDLGAEGESQRLESPADGAVTVGLEHPFGSAIVMLGAGAGGSHLVSVTGSFPSPE